MWVNCFNNYLIEKNLSEIDEIETNELSRVLEDFYSETCKKKGDQGDYKNSTFKCIPAGINRHYKATHSLDIISDQRLVQANEMFKGVNKEQGHDETESLPSIEPEDQDKLSAFFKAKMAGPPDPEALQQIFIYNLIYYMGRRG